MEASETGSVWRIGVDVGGTFTDLVASNSAGDVHVFKALSVPADPAAGVMNALERTAQGLSTTVPDLLKNSALFVHGSTVATNILLERKGAVVGLLTTKGFRDSVELRRGKRDSQWHHRLPSTPVLVPRHLRLPIEERTDRDGAERTPLSKEDVEAAVRTFTEEGVESIAICFINSYLDAAHEKEAADIVERAWSGEWVSVSSDIVPIVGEYERASTTVMNAYVARQTVTYLRTLNTRLRDFGFPHDLLLIQNNGGAISVDQVASRPVTLLLSGPAAGVGALEFYSQAIGSNNLISMEIGGTSCDVILMNQGSVAVVDDLQVAGYHLITPSADVHTIGAGGGTIAGVDDAGMLFVGPRGAGAHPGPASYGLGGSEPTVTDAQLVLGRLKAGPYADGSISLDDGLAREAVERVIAAPLGIEVDAAAAGMLRLLEQNLLHAVQRISTERGHDPRQFVLVASGGAGPMHGAAVGRMLGCTKVYVPRLSGAFCALGMLHSNVRHDFVRSHLERLADTRQEQLDAVYGELEGQVGDILRAEGFETDTIRFIRQMDLRYVGQQWDVRVTVPNDNDDQAAAVRQAFETEHERLFGHHQPEGLVEITNLRVVGIGLIPSWTLAAAQPTTEVPQPIDRRPIYLDEARGWVDTDVYAGGDMRPGHKIDGPLIVEERTTTVFVGPDDVLEVDPANDFVIHVPAMGARDET
jgi:N-methylhydantoinase A